MKMNSFTLLFGLVIPIHAFAGNPQFPKTEDGCHSFVKNFYDWYIAKVNAPPPRHSNPSDEAIQKKAAWFEAGLLALLKDDAEAQSKAAGEIVEIVGIDMDPFLNTQDPAERYWVEKAEWKGDRCTVPVRGKYPGSKKSKVPDVIAQVKFEGHRWKFENFLFPRGPSDLVSMLKALKEQRKK